MISNVATYTVAVIRDHGTWLATVDGHPEIRANARTLPALRHELVGTIARVAGLPADAEVVLELVHLTGFIPPPRPPT